MALEAILDMTFSSASDVWSYGVTLWEIFTLARTPWAIYEFNVEFIDNLKKERRLEHPHFSPTQLYVTGIVKIKTSKIANIN